jgi:hypothetical protein
VNNLVWAWSKAHAARMSIPADHRGRRRVVGVVGGLVLLAVLFGPSLFEHARMSTDYRRTTEDARQHIPPYLRAGSQELFQDDYISGYLASIRPIGYQFFYRTLARWADPRAVSTLLLYPALLALCGACAVAAWRLGGPAAGWLAVALALSSALFVERMGGGLPRTFAYPLYAGAVACLVTGRFMPAGVCVVLSAAFYPTVGVSAGVAMAIVLVCLPAVDRAHAAAWTPLRRWTVLGVTAGLSALLLAPSLLVNQRYGPLVFTDQDVQAYPEIAGRLHPMDRLTYARAVPADLLSFSADTLSNNGKPWSAALRDYLMKGRPPFDPNASRFRRLLAAVLAVTACGLAILAATSAAGRRFLALVLAMLLCAMAARLFRPYLFLPHRHVYLPWPVLLVTGFPAALAEVSRRVVALARGAVPRRAATACTLLAGACLLLAVGGTLPDNSAIRPAFRGEQGKVLQAVAALPADSLVAGWPEGVIENIPYLCGRAVLVSRETHLAWHQGYLDQLRARMRRLISVYFSARETDLAQLHEDFGVTHLLVDERHFRNQGPRYFAPFHTWVREAVALADGEFAALRHGGDAVVFRSRHYRLIDLQVLARTTGGQATGARHPR